jgi:hypothetical protein
LIKVNGVLSRKKGHHMSGNMMAAALAAGVLGIAGAVAIASASPSSAAPIVPGTVTVKALPSTPASDVNYRRGCYGRRYYGRHVYHLRYAHWRHNYRYADCEYTFPATCAYPYPYFGFVYGWHGIW